MRPRTDVIALVSGGLDSLCLVRMLLADGRRVRPVYVRCGLRWEDAELAAARRWLSALRHSRLEPVTVLDVPARPLYGRHWSLGSGRVPSARASDVSVYLPGRNALLLSLAAVLTDRAGASTIMLGTLAGNPFRDASPAFFKSTAAVFSRALSRRITIEAPQRRLTKSRLVRLHADAPLHMTFSCIQPVGRRHCGRCNKCAERRRAFRAARVPDRTRYTR